MNGWDRDPRYEPDLGWSGVLGVIVVIEIGLTLAFGWIFV